MINDVKHNVPYGAPQFEKYDLSIIEPNLVEFERLIDSHIQQLRTRKIDADTAKEYLNSLVDTYITSLYSKLERKHSATKNDINNLFIRRETDKEEFIREIDILDIQIAEATEDRNLLKDLYNKYNTLDKGHLEVTPIRVPTNNGDGDNEE